MLLRSIIFTRRYVWYGYIISTDITNHVYVYVYVVRVIKLPGLMSTHLSVDNAFNHFFTAEFDGCWSARLNRRQTGELLECAARREGDTVKRLGWSGARSFVEVRRCVVCDYHQLYLQLLLLLLAPHQQRITAVRHTVNWISLWHVSTMECRWRHVPSQTIVWTIAHRDIFK